MEKLFGTDGVRGHAGEFPLDDETVFIVGASVARQYRERLGRAPHFVTGRDTRESGPGIEAAFHAGAISEDARVESAEVMTTPGVAFLTSEFEFDAGVVISASHNPYHDNGIKIFQPSGQKLDARVEQAIEADVHDGLGGPRSEGNVDSKRAAEFRSSYARHLLENADGLSCDGMRIVADCAHGAATEFALTTFRALGADVQTIGDKPDGRNINDGCGSLHLEKLRDAVLAAKADLGVAFDGDADRALFVDEKGNVVDGDATLWIMARWLKDHGKLKNSTVVATVMSNLGLEIALRSEGIDLLRASVGDKYVLEKLLETGSEIGGEQSGHIIFPELSLVGDGMMTALLLLRAVKEKGVTVSGAVEGFQRYPQVLLNVKVKEKRPFGDVAAISDAAARIEAELEGHGRLLLRYSGTENLARVMIEGKDQKEIESRAGELASVISSALG